jgi:hexaprenyl-diphosphate synthase
MTSIIRGLLNSTNHKKAREIVSRSSGLEQTRALAQEYVDKAIEAISPFPDSEAKSGLIEMCTKVMKRRK